MEQSIKLGLLSMLGLMMTNFHIFGELSPFVLLIRMLQIQCLLYQEKKLSDSVSIYSVMKLQLLRGNILEYVTQRTLLVIYHIIKLNHLEAKPGQDISAWGIKLK